jgi:hypothetical protein
MILATHALTGAVIGKNINNPWLIIIASLIIHYAMDSIRHGEYIDDRIGSFKRDWWNVALDLGMGFFIIFLIIYFQNPDGTVIRNIFIGVFFSVLPDFLNLLNWIFKENWLLDKIKSLHAWAHRYSKLPKYSKERQWTFRNAVNDIVISCIAIIILLIF